MLCNITVLTVNKRKMLVISNFLLTSNTIFRRAVFRAKYDKPIKFHPRLVVEQHTAIMIKITACRIPAFDSSTFFLANYTILFQRLSNSFLYVEKNVCFLILIHIWIPKCAFFMVVVVLFP